MFEQIDADLAAMDGELHEMEMSTIELGIIDWSDVELPPVE
ncbi:MAG TPA: hypothetical protein VHR66_32895 [Gemmataceae bacterium]|jgi:hypothetical protein|nr:hypothetical protein [Gemmataceae bacterium]